MLSLGLDVGTTTTHHALWRLEPLGFSGAGTWGQPKRLHESAIFPTPWREDGTIDGIALVDLHREALATGGVDLRGVQAAAILVTGMAARSAGIRSSLEHLERLVSGSSTLIASPREEALFAGRAAGARSDARVRLRTAACLDVGGGTASLSVFAPDGREACASLLVGGRMVRVQDGRILSVTPGAQALAERIGVDLVPGERASGEALVTLAREAATACVRALNGEIDPFLCDVGWSSPPPRAEVVYLAGGVAACALEDLDPFRYGDIGPFLGAAIRAALGERLREPAHHVHRATVTGLAVHRFALSGQTRRDDRAVGEGWFDLPLRRVELRGPAEVWTHSLGGDDALYLAIEPGVSWQALRRLASLLVQARGVTSRLALVLEPDLGRALGTALALEGHRGVVVALDGLQAPQADRIDLLPRDVSGAVAGAFRVVEFEGEASSDGTGPPGGLHPAGGGMPQEGIGFVFSAGVR